MKFISAQPLNYDLKMTTSYTAYVKSIDGRIFYFAKSFLTFPKYKNISPILQTYGKHTDFEKACNIAQIFDKDIQMQMLQEIETNMESTKVLPLYTAVAEVYSLRRKKITPSSLLKLIGF